MKMYVTAVFLGLLYGAVAQRPANNNAMIDRTLKWHNQMLTKANYGVTDLQDFNFGELQLSNGVQIGMNSLYRTGDCFAWRIGPNSVYYSNEIGYRLLSLAFGNISYRGESFSGILVVKENALQFDYAIHNDTGSCFVTLDQYRFTEFSEVEFFNSSPRLEEVDLNDLLGEEEDLLQFVNALISQDRRPLEQHLQPLCNRPLEPLPNQPAGEEDEP